MHPNHYHFLYPTHILVQMCSNLFRLQLLEQFLNYIAFPLSTFSLKPVKNLNLISFFPNTLIIKHVFDTSIQNSHGQDNPFRHQHHHRSSNGGPDGGPGLLSPRNPRLYLFRNKKLILSILEPTNNDDVRVHWPHRQQNL